MMSTMTSLLTSSHSAAAARFCSSSHFLSRNLVFDLRLHIRHQLRQHSDRFIYRLDYLHRAFRTTGVAHQIGNHLVVPA